MFKKIQLSHQARKKAKLWFSNIKIVASKLIYQVYVVKKNRKIDIKYFIHFLFQFL